MGISISGLLRKTYPVVSGALFIWLFWVLPCAAEIETKYLYRLSNFSGPVASTWARIALDEARGEIYTVLEKEVRVFNESGMEIYRFGEDGSLGTVLDLAVNNTGDILVISRTRAQQSILVCDFRGMPIGRFALTNFPPDFSGFTPHRMVFKNGRLYLVDTPALKVAVTDAVGRFLKGYDIGALMEIPKKRRIVTDINGFSVDGQGNILFTIPVLFSVHLLTPDGNLTSEKRPGSAPGKFNQVAGIVADDRGYIYVADRLKNAVLIFDRNFQFLMQFGYRGMRPDNLFGPQYLMLDTKGRLYISQLRDQGVSVFRIDYTQP